MAIVINRAVALAVACLTLLSACDGGGEDTPGAATGSLSVTGRFIQNTNILATPQDVPNAANRADLFAFLATRGLLVGQDFGIAVSLALDASSPAGGLATGTDMVFMGCFFCSASASQTLSTDDLAALARAIYHHEIGHIWGWEHEWTGCGSGIEPNCGAFITVAALFGWTDADGDSVPEIIDGTPYGWP